MQKGFNDTLLRAARGEKTEHVPVWYMRQAGRSQPEYRKIKEKYGLFEITHQPELCAYVTRLPVEQYDVDAAILYKDIMSPLPALGVDVEIKAGETVTFRNPMAVSEPHTVTFLKDQSFYPPPAMPVPITFNSTDLKADPNANIDPLIITDQNGTKSVLVDNAQHYNPVTVSSGYNVTYLPINANYTLTGTEKFVSSGWMWPDGLAPKGAPPIKSFSVTFEKPGTYDYICMIHPWMNGVITVT